MMDAHRRGRETDAAHGEHGWRGLVQRPRGSADQEAVRRAGRSMALQVAGACAVAVLAVVVCAWIVLAHLSQPAEMMENASKPGAIVVDGGDVLAALVAGGLVGVAAAGVIGWLSARRAVRPLAQALDAQRRFVADASHELRTPLAVLDARIQLAQQRAGDSPAAEVLVELRRDSARLTEVVQDMLALTATPGPPPEPVQVGAIVQQVVQSMAPVADDAGVDLSCQVAVDGAARVEGSTLARMVRALVDNALAHTPDGGAVTVRVGCGRGEVLISVRDTGSGIEGIDPERIFDRFASGGAGGIGGAGASGRRRGYGIGLSLVKEAAARSGGDVQVLRTGPAGTEFEVRLPAE